MNSGGIICKFGYKLKDSIRNYKLLRYLMAPKCRDREGLFFVACKIYNILWDITTWYNSVGLCRNFENSSGVVSCKFAQLDTTRFYEKLRISTISDIIDSISFVICYLFNILQDLQRSMRYYNIRQLYHSVTGILQ